MVEIGCCSRLAGRGGLYDFMSSSSNVGKPKMERMTFGGEEVSKSLM